MKNALTALLLTLCLNYYALAQTKDAPAQPSGKSNKTQKAVTTQSPELTEADDLSARVLVLYGERQYDKALSLAKRILALREKSVGQENELTANALSNLAAIYAAKAEYRESETLYKRALKILERSAGEDSFKVSVVFENYAFVLFAVFDYNKAESSYQRVLSIREKVLKPEDENLTRAIYNLAQFYSAKGEYEKADSFYQRLITIKEKTHQPKSPELIKAFDDYACLMLKKKQEDKAREILSRNHNVVYKKPRDSDGNITSEVLNGKALNRPEPVYPAIAKAARQQGVVPVQIFVDEAGNVTCAAAISGPPLLIKSAEQASYQTRFSPTLVSGQPAFVVGLITMSYSIR